MVHSSWRRCNHDGNRNVSRGRHPVGGHAEHQLRPFIRAAFYANDYSRESRAAAARATDAQPERTRPVLALRLDLRRTARDAGNGALVLEPGQVAKPEPVRSGALDVTSGAL